MVKIGSTGDTKKYKSMRLINGKPKWVITDEYRNIINYSPTKEDIKFITDERYKPKKCCTCRIENINVTYLRCKCNKKECTRHLCHKCWDEYYRKNNPNSHPNLVKSITNIRTGNLNRNSEKGKSIIDQAVVAKILNIEDLNIKKDNFAYYIDLNDDKLGKIDVKGSIPRCCRAGYSERDKWTFDTRMKIDCDTYICIGYDFKRRNIEAVYIIPNEGWISSLTKLTITRNASKISKYDEFQIEDIDIYNNTYHSILSYLGNRKYFGVDDIKKWDRWCIKHDN